MSLAQLGLAVEQWVRGILVCLTVLGLVLLWGWFTLRRRRSPVAFLVGTTILVGCVYLTQFVPGLNEAVYEPLRWLGHLF